LIKWVLFKAMIIWPEYRVSISTGQPKGLCSASEWTYDCNSIICFCFH